MARKNRSGLTASVLDALRKRNLTQAQIAEMFDVTPQYVSWVKREYGGVTATPREETRKHFPFKVPERFNGSSYDKRLRDHLEFSTTGGVDMSKDQLRRLRWFYRKLQANNLVVEFDPNNPPEPGNKLGGYALRPREESDGDLIIRVNDDTRLTPEGEKLWRFPPELPSV